jgi:hypothetical protein
LLTVAGCARGGSVCVPGRVSSDLTCILHAAVYTAQCGEPLSLRLTYIYTVGVALTVSASVEL